MSYRLHIALIIVVFPLLGAAVLLALSRYAPLPDAGRDYVVRLALAEPGASVDLPDIAGPDDPARPLVVIDAGHGGHDPGATGAELREKALTLDLAHALRDRLLGEGGIRVALTREDDRFLALAERVEIARALDADLFVSIHADSAGEKEGITGASVYTLSDEASSEAAARFAARENRADQVNGVVLTGQSPEVSSILVELSQRRTSGQSSEFAGLIEREGREDGHIRFHPQAQRSAGLAVLRAPDVPSVLFEAGFISNPEEEQRLASIEGQESFAEAMAQAIRVYFARRSAEG